MKILLADDHQLIRDGLRTMLVGTFTQAPVFVEVGSFEAAHQALAWHQPMALAIVDMRMSGVQDAKAVEQLARAFAAVPFVVLSGFLQPGSVRQLLALPSVFAVLSKDGPPSSLRFAVLEALDGRKLGDAHRLLDGQETSDCNTDPKVDPLSPRLQGIYDRLREGKSNKAIAWELGLSEGTVKNYVSTIYRQLNVHNRIQAVWANETPPSDRP